MNLTIILKIRIVVLSMMLCSLNTLAFCAPLKVGVGISGPPIVERINTPNGPYYFGFCIDLMNTICHRIGKQCIYQDITLANQFDLLDRGEIDLLILASPYMAFDLREYARSIPYANSKIQFIALRNSPIHQLGDIKNKKIGVMRSTFYRLLLQSSYQNHNQIIPYSVDADLLSDLAQHKVDVIVMNNAIAYRLATNDFYNIKLVGNDLALGDGYGIIALPDKMALIEKINAAILSIQKDGTYTAIYRKYYDY